jgi:hypothetical protein
LIDKRKRHITKHHDFHLNKYHLIYSTVPTNTVLVAGNAIKKSVFNQEMVWISKESRVIKCAADPQNAWYTRPVSPPPASHASVSVDLLFTRPKPPALRPISIDPPPPRYIRPLSTKAVTNRYHFYNLRDSLMRFLNSFYPSDHKTSLDNCAFRKMSSSNLYLEKIPRGICTGESIKTG